MLGEEGCYKRRRHHGKVASPAEKPDQSLQVLAGGGVGVLERSCGAAAAAGAAAGLAGCAAEGCHRGMGAARLKSVAEGRRGRSLAHLV